MFHLILTPSKRGPPGFWTCDLSHPKPVITHSTPRLWRCPASISVPYIGLPVMNVVGLRTIFLHVIQWVLVVFKMLDLPLISKNTITIRWCLLMLQNCPLKSETNVFALNVTEKLVFSTIISLCRKTKRTRVFLLACTLQNFVLFQLLIF